MKSGIMYWVSHSNMPILSVDVQPNGFRFVTGGSDHKVCIWNLLPAISLKYENPPRLVPPKQDGDLSIIAEETKGGGNSNKYHSEGDEVMRSENNSNDDGQDEDEGTVDSATKWRDCENALNIEDEEGFEEDVKLMEELFVDIPNKRYQRLLAVIESHEAPVNCVRWNSVGTLFASAADDGTVVLQEYFGEMSASGMSDFQKYQFNTDASQSGTNRGFGLPNGSTEENKGETDKKDENSTYEKWRCKRSWNVHKGGVSDLAWSPDNIHLGTCGTDSTVIIWNINETSPIRIIESKANGISFDPFGKFMATQSSEDRSLTIWRIQQNFKNITQECMHNSYYKQSQSMSMFRRLSWSADGQFISTTAGRCGGFHTAPLIERSSWRLAATLSGHHKTITSSRINPRLYRDDNQESGNNNLSCYSIVAIASIDSTITVWKPGMNHPLTVEMDVFHMGISDLSWGFNGNILLASSHDGKVVLLHYQPGRLGQPLSELEKQLIIEKRYGTSVLNEYKSHTKVQQAQQAAAVSNSSAQSQQEQKNVLLNGKKKIVPITTMQYSVNLDINPYLNPFHNQMLKDDSARTFQGSAFKTQLNQIQQQSFPELTFNYTKPPQQQTSPQVSLLAQAVQPIQTQAVSVKQDTFPNQLSVVVPTQQINPLISLIDLQPNFTTVLSVQAEKQVSLGEEDQKESSNALENSGKKTKKTKKQKKDDQQQISQFQLPTTQSVSISQQNQAPGNYPNQFPTSNAFAQLPGKQEFKSSNISQQTLSLVQREQYSALERLLLDNQQSVTVMSLEDYQALTCVQGKEEIQLVLPSRDIFSDEIRVLISNQDVQTSGGNVFSRKSSADLRFYSGSENFMVDRKVFEGEFIVMTSLCTSFFILYTSNGKLSVFSTRSIQPIKQGLVLEGACFIESNDDAMCFVVLTLKGHLSVYRVKNGLGDQGMLLGMQSMGDACTIEWQTSIAEILKQRNAANINSLDSNGGASSAGDISSSLDKRVTVRYIKLMNDVSVLVFLSDETVFEYDPKIRTWRQSLLSGPQATLMQDQLRGAASQNLSNANQEFGHHAQQALPLLKDLSSIISQLEKQTIQDQQQHSDLDVEMQSQTSLGKQVVDNYTRLNELQESLQLYDRLQMKNEFIYTLRMYTLALIQLGDMSRLRDMLLEYKFVMSWDDERQIELSKGQAAAGGAMKIMSKESAYGHMMHLVMLGEQDQINGENGQVSAKVIEKPLQLICGTIGKATVFQQAILPVIKTVSAHLNCEVKDYIAQIVNSIFSSSNTNNGGHQLQQQQHQQQVPQIQLPSMQRVAPQFVSQQQQQHSIVDINAFSMASMGQVNMSGIPTQLPSISNVLNAAMLAAPYGQSGNNPNSLNPNNGPNQVGVQSTSSMTQGTTQYNINI